MGTLKVWTTWERFTREIEPGCPEMTLNVQGQLLQQPPPGWTWHPQGHASYEWDKAQVETLVKPQLIVQEAVEAGQLVWEVAKEGAEPKPVKEFNPDAEVAWVFAPISGG